MKALIPTGDARRLVEFGDVPEPEAGDGQIVIAVEAFSVNLGETFLLRAPRPNWRPGQDIAGRIVATTAGGPPVGARVVALADQDGWAERTAVPADRVVVLPGSVATTDAAGVPLAGLTALRLVRQAGAVIGRRLLLTGASGGVGHLLTQLAAGAGAEVTAVTASAERGKHLLDLGAVATVRSVDEAEGPFDLALESVGGPTLIAVAGLVHPEHGRVLWYGQASGQTSELDLFALMGAAPNLKVEMFVGHRSAFAEPGDLATLVRLIASGRLEVPQGRVTDWSDTADVLNDLAQRRVVGKAVLTIS